MPDIEFDKQSSPVRLVGGGDDNETYTAGIHNELGDNWQLVKAKFPTDTYDSLGRIQTVQPYTLFYSKLNFDNQAVLWDTKTVGSGSVTWNQPTASSILSVGTASGDKAIRQTKEYFLYQPGKSHFISTTFVLGAKKSNVRKRVGYFDADNGIFIEQDGSNLKAVLRTKITGSVVDTAVNQSIWNIDTLDGSGPSGITLDETKVQLLVIRFLWLGIGDIELGFVIDGRIIYFHKFVTTNIGTNVHLASPNLPVRFEIENTGTSASSTDLKSICTNVSSLGELKPRAFVFSKDSGLISVIKDTKTALVSIRLKSTNIRQQIIPSGIFGEVDLGDYSLFELILNPTLGGTPSWSSVDDDSAVEYDVDSTTVTDGRVLFSAFVDRQYSSESDLFSLIIKGLADIDGVADILTLACTPTKNNTNALGGIIWREPI